MEYYTNELIRIIPQVSNDEIVETIKPINVSNYKFVKASFNVRTCLAVSSAEEIDSTVIRKLTENHGHEDEIISIINEAKAKSESNKEFIFEDMNRKVTFALYPYGLSENAIYEFNHNLTYPDKMKKMCASTKR